MLYLQDDNALSEPNFQDTVLKMCFVPTIANPDIYRRQNTKGNGFKHYEFILFYIDDALIVSHNPTTVHLESTQSRYEVNLASIGTPTRYLGADVRKVTRPGGDPSGREKWAFSAS